MEQIILFFQRGLTGMPEAWPRDAASRSLFSGNYGYICNLRRSLPKGTSTLHPLEGGGGGPRLVTLITWPCPQSSDRDGPGPPRRSGSDLDQRGIHNLNAAERAFASLNFSTTISTDVPNNSDGETGASRRNYFFFSPMSARFIHRCLSLATIATIDLPMAAAVCLVALSARSVVRRNSVTASGGSP